MHIFFVCACSHINRLNIYLLSLIHDLFYKTIKNASQNSNPPMVTSLSNIQYSWLANSHVSGMIQKNISSVLLLAPDDEGVQHCLINLKKMVSRQEYVTAPLVALNLLLLLFMFYSCAICVMAAMLDDFITAFSIFPYI